MITKSIFLTALVTGCALAAPAQYKNQKIADDCLQPAIDVNYKNPSNIVIAGSNGSVHYSVDGGRTWLEAKNKFAASLPASPQMKSTAQGELLLIHTSAVDQSGKSANAIVARVSKTGGKGFSPESVVTSSSREKLDPQIVVHPKRAAAGITWTEIDASGSSDPACHSEVFYSASGAGDNWGTPKSLSQTPGDCSGKETMLHSPFLAMDDQHKIFATWEVGGGMVMDRSYDGGKTWLSGDMAAFRMDGTRVYAIPGIDRVVRTPLFMADNSKSVLQNSLYLIWADQRNGSNDTDIWMATSVRRGDSWGPPVRVNKDEKGKHQFMPAATIDPYTGVIYVVYYDRRNYSDNQTDVYLAWSVDGGTKFSERKISDTPFTPTESVPFTGHISISAVSGVIAPCWVRMDEGKTSVWTAILSQEDIIQAVDMPKMRTVIKTPHGSSNPYSAPLQQKFKKPAGS